MLEATVYITVSQYKLNESEWKVDSGRIEFKYYEMCTGEY